MGTVAATIAVADLGQGLLKIQARITGELGRGIIPRSAATLFVELGMHSHDVLIETLCISGRGYDSVSNQMADYRHDEG